MIFQNVDLPGKTESKGQTANDNYCCHEKRRVTILLYDLNWCFNIRQRERHESKEDLSVAFSFNLGIVKAKLGRSFSGTHKNWHLLSVGLQTTVFSTQPTDFLL